MKKVIVSIIVIGLLLSTGSTIMGETANEPTISEFDEQMSELSNLDSFIKPEFTPGEIIIKFKENSNLQISDSSNEILTTGIESIDALNKEYEVYSVDKLIEDSSVSSLLNTYVLKLPEDSDILLITEDYEEDPNVEFAEPNYIIQSFLNQELHASLDNPRKINPVNFGDPFFPDDPLFEYQWALHNTGQNIMPPGYDPIYGTPDADIDAPEAWDISMGENVVIAMLDTGVDYTHEDLADNIWINEDEIPDNGIDDDNNGYIDDIRGWDFVGSLGTEEDNDPMDHGIFGTVRAGVAAAVSNNGIGIAGVAGNCKIMPLVLFGQLVEEPATIIEAVKSVLYAIDNGADIICMSWEFSPLAAVYITVFNLALSHADSRGLVLVATAGDLSTIMYPAAHEKVIAVSATDKDDSIIPAAFIGSWVDVAAPGGIILSTLPEDGYSKYIYVSGASMTSPHVAGVAALIISKAKNQGLQLTPAEVRTILRSSIDPLTYYKYVGTGRINADTSLQKTAQVTAELDPSLDSIRIKKLTKEAKIRGVAYGEGFQKYVLECKKGTYPEEGEWIQIEMSSTQKYRKLPLAQWDTTTVSDGLYTLRLRVIAGGITYEDRTLVTVDNTADALYVDDDADPSWYDETHFDNIQDAIDSCGILGGEIYVYNGTYCEIVQIYFKSSIKLIGENKNTTVIENNANIPENMNRPKALPSILISASINIQISNFAIISNFEEGNEWNQYPGEGILIELSYKCLISDNNLYSIAGENVTFPLGGIDLWPSRNNVITRNNFTRTRGIKCSGNNNVISYNIIKDFSNNGIELESNSNKIYNNTIINSTSTTKYSSAIFVRGPCRYNVIYNNIFSTHVATGIYLLNSSKNNIIYHNNFINNRINAWDEGDNIWYKFKLFGKSTGNYWDDYIENGGYDNNGDGIGDIPYNIPGGNNQDPYPLMDEYSGSQSSPSSNPQSQPSSQQSTPTSTTNSSPISRIVSRVVSSPTNN